MLSIFDDSNYKNYSNPAYLLELVDQNSISYYVVVSGYGGPLEDSRVRDLLSGLNNEDRVNWNNCSKFEEAQENFSESP